MLIYGHGDVVAGHDSQWTGGRSPWQVSADGGRWYGRGTADNKGQHSINLAALGQVLAARGRLGFNAKLLIEMGEEVGSPGLRRICETRAMSLRADVLIASDGPRLRSDRPTIFLGSRGDRASAVALRCRVRLADVRSGRSHASRSAWLREGGRATVRGGADGGDAARSRSPVGALGGGLHRGHHRRASRDPAEPWRLAAERLLRRCARSADDLGAAFLSRVLAARSRRALAGPCRARGARDYDGAVLGPRGAGRRAGRTADRRADGRRRVTAAGGALFATIGVRAGVAQW
ncbi:MAG: M20/M25/M40 family metallo-hydrolase [Casimicrobiaceae bacterium]